LTGEWYFKGVTDFVILFKQVVQLQVTYNHFQQLYEVHDTVM